MPSYVLTTISRVTINTEILKYWITIVDAERSFLRSFIAYVLLFCVELTHKHV